MKAVSAGANENVGEGKQQQRPSFSHPPLQMLASRIVSRIVAAQEQSAEARVGQHDAYYAALSSNQSINFGGWCYTTAIHHSEELVKSLIKKYRENLLHPRIPRSEALKRLKTVVTPYVARHLRF